MEVAGKITEIFGVVPRTFFHRSASQLVKWILPKANTVEGDIEMTFSPNSWHLLRHATEVACQHANRTEAARCFSPAKKEKNTASIVEAVWPFTPYRHGIIVIICNILVLNVGNFREWSISSLEIIPAPATHPFPTFSTAPGSHLRPGVERRSLGCTWMIIPLKVAMLSNVLLFWNCENTVLSDEKLHYQT
jgi:hypothetical protein